MSCPLQYGRENEGGGKGATKEGIAELCERIRTGVRQQRTRGKTKERACTLPLALSMFRRNASAHGEVDLLKEVQGSDGQTTVQDAAEEYEIIYSKGDVVALKHNYKRYTIPFFLAVLLKDLPHNGDAFQEDHMGLRLLKSQKKISLYTRLGTVVIEIHLSVYHRESSNNERSKQLLFELP